MGDVADWNHTQQVIDEYGERFKQEMLEALPLSVRGLVVRVDLENETQRVQVEYVTTDGWFYGPSFYPETLEEWDYPDASMPSEPSPPAASPAVAEADSRE